MSTEDRYRKYAAFSLDLAIMQPCSADKNRLLLMAEAWLDLADRIARYKPTERHGVDHPLVEMVLGRERPSVE
ncbi:MAG TPA: hypothetical protein VMF12_03315 [Xanthobacteraceae bacterium]|nr:hypothetical protein [Xanthobacteraceae bacterium]